MSIKVTRYVKSIHKKKLLQKNHNSLFIVKNMLGVYPTILIIFPGTIITFLGVLPSNCA